MITVKKTNPIVLAIGMLMFSFFSTAHVQIAAPTVAAMAADLRVTDTTLIGMIMNLPSLTCIPTVLVCGKLCERMSKKTVWVIGATIWVVGGVGAIFFDNIIPVLVFRAVIGIGAGLVIPLVSAIVADYFPSEKVVGRMGINLGSSGLWAALMAALSGTLLAYGWRASYALHLIAIPIVIIGFLCVPKEPIVQAQTIANVSDDNADRKKGHMPPIVYLYSIVIGITLLPIRACWSYASIFSAEEGMATAAQTALALSLLSLFSAASAMSYGKISAIFKRFTFTAAMVILVLSCVIILYAKGVVALFISMGLLGLMQGMFMPGFLHGAASAVPPHKQTLAQSVVLVGVYIGEFLSSIWYTLGTAIMGSTTARAVFTFNMWFVVGMVVISVIVALKKTKNSTVH